MHIDKSPGILIGRLACSSQQHVPRLLSSALRHNYHLPSHHSRGPRPLLEQHKALAESFKKELTPSFFRNTLIKKLKIEFFFFLGQVSVPRARWSIVPSPSKALYQSPISPVFSDFLSSPPFHHSLLREWQKGGLLKKSKKTIFFGHWHGAF